MNTTLSAQLIHEIEVPEAKYKQAIERYEDLGEWLCRPDSNVRQYDPSIDIQGSFGIGTAIRPMAGHDFDLDLVVTFRTGLRRKTITQQQFTQLVRDELEGYRKARGIQQPLEQKNRCLRLCYRGFHIDIVHAIPGSDRFREELLAEMNARKSVDESLRDELARLAIFITDKRKSSFPQISKDWEHSNPIGHRHWFINCMNQGNAFNQELELNAKVEQAPIYMRKTPLQQAVQLMKRHRDTVFSQNSDAAPISIIISTLAAKYYRGDSDPISTIQTLINPMQQFAGSPSPELRNPVDPLERFTDRWQTEKGRRLGLQPAFRNWVQQLSRDVEQLAKPTTNLDAVKSACERFGSQISTDRLTKEFGVTGALAGPAIVTASASAAPRPWHP